MFDDCIIMAGGSGTRLWPASSSRLPKQFLAGPGGKSFFLQALERGLGVTAPSGRVIVIAGKVHADSIVGDCASLGEESRGRILLLVEPAARNTAPAIACGLHLAETTGGGDRRMLVLTSDHVIEPPEDFYAAARAAAAHCGGSLVVFGIAPLRPETGYGYIEAAERILSEIPSEIPLFRAASFREKPDRVSAEGFLARGNFYWNSGMFAFSSAFLREEFARNAPDILAPFAGLSAPGADAFTGGGRGIRVLENWPGLAEAYRGVRAESIDYAIAEKCRQVLMAAGSFRWFDVGSWDEYARLVGKSPSEIYALADSPEGSCFVYSDIPVALCGVEDLVVVIRSGGDGLPAAALVAKKGETQKVRDIVAMLKADGRSDLV